MKTNPGRFRPAKRIILCFIALAATVVAFAADSTLIQWGQEPSQLGLINQPEVERQGPLTFTASSDGRIVIADTVNTRLVEYRNENGRLKFSRVLAEKMRPTSIAFGQDGELLLLEGHTVTILKPDGTPSGKISLPESLPLVEGYGQEVFPEGSLIGVNDPDENVTLMDRATGRMVRQTVGRQAGSTGRRLTTAITGPASAELRARDDAGRLSAGLPPVTAAPRNSGERLGAVLFRGMARGRPVAEVEHVGTGRVRLTIESADASGKSTALELPNDYFTTIYKKFEVLEDGTVWQMLTTPAGVEFRRTPLP